jgi:DUF4097 and DUF4098 domain-containing protein YvlB
MLQHAFRCLAAMALGATLMLAQTQVRRHHDFNLSIHDNSAEHCSDLQAEARGGSLAQASESFMLPRSQGAALEINVPDRGNIRVFGAPQADFSVEVCKFAVAGDGGTAEQVVQGITVQRSAGRLSASDPTVNAEADWSTYFIVHAPKDAPLNLDANNGAIAVRGMDGQVKMHAVNGPLAVRDCGGRVDAETVNGPIAFEGSGGDIHLQAQNGPIAVKISGDLWNGNQLEATTNNGPLSLKFPDSFRSGVRVESSGHSPMSCKASACANAAADFQGGQRVIQMNGSQGTIHVSTHNGPVSVATEGSRGRVI